MDTAALDGRWDRLKMFASKPTDRQTPLAPPLALAFLAVALGIPAQAQRAPDTRAAPARSAPPLARKLILRGVPNFGEVTPTLYRGGQPSREGFRNLAKMAINIVVDLRGSRESERRLVNSLGMQYVPLPWRCYHPRDEPLAKFLLLIRENSGKRIFVHCSAGDDRTGMDIAAYRMAVQGWTPAEARKEMEAFGETWFHRMLCPGLPSYEKEFPARFKTSPAFASLRSEKPAAAPRR
jgi:tyrosine-protein phosphatase SIW14